MATDSPKLARFEQAVMPHFDAAYSLARWLTRRADIADDVVQEAYAPSLFSTVSAATMGGPGYCQLCEILVTHGFARITPKRF